MSKVCTTVLPDKVVMCLANNDENFTGSAMMHHYIKNSPFNSNGTDIICAITRFPSDEEGTFRDRLKIYEDDPNKRNDNTIKELFYKEIEKIYGIIEEAEKNRIYGNMFVIHSNREVERDELVILQNKRFVKRDRLENDYGEIINKLFRKDEDDKLLLEKRETLIENKPKYRFIQFNLLGIIKDELEKLQNDTFDTDISNPYRLLYERALHERLKDNIPDAVMSLFSLIENADADVKWKTYAHYLRGIIFLYDLHNYKKSIKDLTLVHNTDSAFNSHICYDLALCYYCLGCSNYLDCSDCPDCEYHSYPKHAKDYIERYISENEDDYRAFLLRANIKTVLKKEQRSEIIDDYNKAIELNKNFADSYNCRGIYYYNIEEFQKAREDYDKAIEIDSVNELEKQKYFVYGNRGNLYFKMNELENALKDYEKAIKIYPNYSVAYKCKGDIYTRLGKITEALEEYKKALKINPDYEEAYNSFKKIGGKPKAYYDVLNDNLDFDFQYVLRYDSTKDHVKHGFPIKYYRTNTPFEFALIEEEDRTILSDQGRTLEMLEKIFELREYDVSKNLATILKEFHVFKNGFDFSFSVEIGAKEEKVIDEAKYRLFCCVSFMNKMRIFYDKAEFNPDESKFKIFDGLKLLKSESIKKYPPFPAKYYKSDVEYEFALVEKDGKMYITDQGQTYHMLDAVFDVREPDVQKNLHAIMETCNVSQMEDEFLIEINTWDVNSETENEEEKEVKHRLLECVSFMNTMRIFYV